MIRNLHLKSLFWIAVLTWTAILFLQGVPVQAALLKPTAVVLGVVTGITAVFERYAWAWPVFRGWFVSTPVLIGTFEGSIDSSFVNPSTGAKIDKIHALISIHQTLSSITVRLLTSESGSVSLCASLIESPDGYWDLVAIYRNEPGLAKQPQSRIHHGALRLQVHEKGSELIGSYFTDRSTHGEVTFKRVTRALTTRYAQTNH